MAYKEIVTKAVIAKGKKKYKNTYEISVGEKPTTVLGCWIINHNFEAHDEGDKISIDGSFDANIWYSYDNDTKTAVANKRITYTEHEKLNLPDNEILNKDIIVRSLKQPTCISAKEDGNTINIEIIIFNIIIKYFHDSSIKKSGIQRANDVSSRYHLYLSLNVLMRLTSISIYLRLQLFKLPSTNFPKISFQSMTYHP